MFEEDILLLGHRYRRLNDPNETVGIGDLVHFNPPLERDAEWYMFRFDYKYDAMVLVNWIGYEAGLEHAVAQIKKNDMEPNKLCVRLGWIEENWHKKFISESAFAQASFYKFERD